MKKSELRQTIKEEISKILNEDDEFKRKYQSVQGTIKELAGNREHLTRLYAQLINNNKSIGKMYVAMDAMIDQGRDNIASNWKDDLARLEGEYLNLITNINNALEEEKILMNKIK